MYIEVSSIDWFKTLLHFKTNETAANTYMLIKEYLISKNNMTSDRKIMYAFDNIQNVFSVLSLNDQNKIDERFTISVYFIDNDSHDDGVYVSFYTEIRSSMPYPVSRLVYNDLKQLLTESKKTLMEAVVG